MRVEPFDRPLRGTSPVHRLPAGLKLAVAIGMVIGMISLPMGNAPWLALPALLLIGIALFSRISLRDLLLRLLWLEPMAVGVALLSLLQPHGLVLFAMLLSRTTLCLLTMLLLSATTPFADLLAVLKQIHVPTLLITTLALMYRYLFLLGDEGARLKRARSSRTFTHTHRFAWRNAADVISQLFIRCCDRAERIYLAMSARGWR